MSNSTRPFPSLMNLCSPPFRISFDGQWDDSSESLTDIAQSCDPTSELLHSLLYYLSIILPPLDITLCLVARSFATLSPRLLFFRFWLRFVLLSGGPRLNWLLFLDDHEQCYDILDVQS